MTQLSNGRSMASQLYLRSEMYQSTLVAFPAVDIAGTRHNELSKESHLICLCGIIDNIN
jgi:hypothetical protein